MKHKNYEILNLLGYGLAKFNEGLVRELGYSSKTQFYDFCVSVGIADTPSTIKNRQDLFDPFFDNGRKGWWQKGDAYIHRKIFIDSLFGQLNLAEYAGMIRLYLKTELKLPDIATTGISPILKSKFAQLQKTGREAELFFMNNYLTISEFANGYLEDARMLGDGYDFQIQVEAKFFLTEIKGLRQHRGAIRFTEKEYATARSYKNDYALVVVSSLSDIPSFKLFFNPINTLTFNKAVVNKEQITYNSFV